MAVRIRNHWSSSRCGLRKVSWLGLRWTDLLSATWEGRDAQANCEVVSECLTLCGDAILLSMLRDLYSWGVNTGDFSIVICPETGFLKRKWNVTLGKTGSNVLPAWQVPSYRDRSSWVGNFDHFASILICMNFPEGSEQQAWEGSIPGSKTSSRLPPSFNKHPQNTYLVPGALPPRRRLWPFPFEPEPQMRF